MTCCPYNLDQPCPASGPDTIDEILAEYGPELDELRAYVAARLARANDQMPLSGPETGPGAPHSPRPNNPRASESRASGGAVRAAHEQLDQECEVLHGVTIREYQPQGDPMTNSEIADIIRDIIEQQPSCEATVTRAGIVQPCCKPAAGLALVPDDDFGPWPACAWHLNRWGAVPLLDILNATQDLARQETTR